MNWEPLAHCRAKRNEMKRAKLVALACGLLLSPVTIATLPSLKPGADINEHRGTFQSPASARDHVVEIQNDHKH